MTHCVWPSVFLSHRPYRANILGLEGAWAPHRDLESSLAMTSVFIMSFTKSKMSQQVEKEGLWGLRDGPGVTSSPHSPWEVPSPFFPLEGKSGNEPRLSGSEHLCLLCHLTSPRLCQGQTLFQFLSHRTKTVGGESLEHKT